MTDFFLLDSRLSPNSLIETPYMPTNFDLRAADYKPPTGIFLLLHGRSANGRSVTVETELTEGLSIFFLLSDELDDDADNDDACVVETVRNEILMRGQMLLEKGKTLDNLSWTPPPVELSANDVEGDMVQMPCFYGFEPSSADPLQPRPRRIVKLTTHHLRVYHALRQAAEEALHDRPLECGARPCELAGSPHVAALEARGLAHCMWVQASGHNAQSAADVTLICSTSQLVDLPGRVGIAPPLNIASYDIECCAGPPAASGGCYAFPNAFKAGHAVRCIALCACTTTNVGSGGMRRFFLHTGPHELTASNCRDIALDEGAVEAADELEMRWFQDEPALLLGFAALLRDTVKPDILFSYNGNAFDAPYLQQRIEYHLPAPSRELDKEQRALMWTRRRAAHAWGRTPMNARPPKKIGVPPSEVELREIERKRREGKIIYESCAFDAPGVAHHDVLDFGQSLNLETSKLADVASEVLSGTTKTDLEIGDMMDIMQGVDVKGWARIAVYNLRDAELPLRIMVAKEQVAFSVQVSAVSGCSLPEVCAGGQQKRLLSMVRREVRRRGLLFNEPSKLDFEGRPWLCGGGEKVKGATVLDIEPGWYRDPVVTCDYSSLYPSILISRNLCPSKLLLEVVGPSFPPSLPNELAATVRTFKVEERDDDIVHYHHVLQLAADGSGQGVFPAIASRLLQERKTVKHEMKQVSHDASTYVILDAKQQALKVIANSLYGALNAVLKGSLYCRPLGGIVTAEGRRAIAAIQDEVARVEGAIVVAGDTDSVMFKLTGRTLAQASEIGAQVAASVTARLHADGALAMELAYEKTMLPSVFVAKKSYAYVCHTPGKPPSIVSMGLMSKKRGTAMLFKHAFIDCERAYLLNPAAFTEAEVLEIQLLVLRNMERLLYSDATPPAAFAKTTMLKAEEAYTLDYRAPHVDAARRLVTRTGCAWPGNARFAYVQVKANAIIPKSKFIASDHSMEVGLFAQSKATIDGAFYVSSVHKRFEALLKFTIPDAPDRFKKLIEALERKPASPTLDISSFCDRGGVFKRSEIQYLFDRSYKLDGCTSGAASLETRFWKDSLKEDSQVAKPEKSVFDNRAKPMRNLTGSHVLTQQTLRVQAPAGASGSQPTPSEKGEVREEASKRRVEEKKRKLEDASAAIAAQPRRGATNAIPASKKAAEKPHATMMMFFKKR